MIFRRGRQPESGDSGTNKISDLPTFEEAINQLPKIQPRPGLKHQMFADIMKEVQREEVVPKKPTFRFPTFGFTVSLAGVAFAALFTFTMLPSMLGTDAPPALRSGAGTTELSQEEQQKLEEAERERALLRQVIPHTNGQYIGEGVEITIQDKQARLIRKGTISEDVETSVDLYRLVQEIYGNGGQLITINGIMVEPYTEIVSHGNLLEISERRVQAPFTMKVIGDSKLLYDTLKDNQSVLSKLGTEEDMEIDLRQSRLITIAMEEADGEQK
jgi:hypothetical protein